MCLNVLNYSGYRDCRPDCIQAIQQVLRLETRQGREGEAISISTPLIELNKTEIIKLGNNWRVPSEKT
ncbi:7-cyano-7-deazaguanine synthase [Microcoleus sp. Pol11C1]|uniref:7-cyano-7-deazaguanine synthase n=1 Tax=unclassified Microcoleus TaxID=2642155 RepID=UPI002FD1DF1A